MTRSRYAQVEYIREPEFLYCGADAVGAAAHAVARGWSMRAARCLTAVERAVPDSCTEIYFSLGPFGRHLVGPDAARASIEPRAAWVVGPHADSIFLSKEVTACDLVAVRVLPGMIPSVLGVSAGEVSGTLLDLDLFWGRGAVEQLRERLFDETDALARVRMLETEVARRSLASTHDSRRLRELCIAVEQVPSPTVGVIARRFGLSHRRMISLFDDHIGLKPKVYQRIQRLRAVLERVAADGVGSWARVAYEGGYCDQAHLVNEFQRLTGMTPTFYQQSKSPVGAGMLRHALADPA